MIKRIDIVRFVKSQKLAWLGLVSKLNHERVTIRIANWKLTGRRLGGRSRKRWLDNVEEDLSAMRAKG